MSWLRKSRRPKSALSQLILFLVQLLGLILKLKVRELVDEALGATSEIDSRAGRRRAGTRAR